MKMKLWLATGVLTLSSSSCMGLTDQTTNLASEIALEVMNQVADSIDNATETSLVTNPEEERFTKSYNIQDFSAIEAGGVFQIIYTQGQNYTVKIGSNQDILKRIKVYKEEEELKLEMNGNVSANDLTVRVYITSPTLKKLDLSGACSFTTENITTNNRLKMDISGAAKIKIGSVQCQSLDMDASGAMKIAGTFVVKEDVKWDCSGAAKADVQITARKISIDNSGAVKMAAKVNCQVLEVENNGASKLTLSGTADKTDFDNSGVSHIITTDLNKF